MSLYNIHNAIMKTQMDAYSDPVTMTAGLNYFSSECIAITMAQIYPYLKNIHDISYGTNEWIQIRKSFIKSVPTFADQFEIVISKNKRSKHVTIVFAVETEKTAIRYNYKIQTNFNGETKTIADSYFREISSNKALSFPLDTIKINLPIFLSIISDIRESVVAAQMFETPYLFQITSEIITDLTEDGVLKPALAIVVYNTMRDQIVQKTIGWINEKCFETTAVKRIHYINADNALIYKNDNSKAYVFQTNDLNGLSIQSDQNDCFHYYITKTPHGILSIHGFDKANGMTDHEKITSLSEEIPLLSYDLNNQKIISTNEDLMCGHYQKIIREINMLNQYLEYREF